MQFLSVKFAGDIFSYKKRLSQKSEQPLSIQYNDKIS